MKQHGPSLFITPEQFEEKKAFEISGPNGWILFVACNDGAALARSVKREYEYLLSKNNSPKQIPLLGTAQNPLTRIFSDSESCSRLDKPVAGSNAYVFQCVHHNSSSNSVNENIQQLLQTVRTLRAHRAKTITVVIPYCPYSRQEKPSHMAREAVLARLFADQLKIAGADVFLTYHPHTPSLYGFYEPKVVLVSLSGLDLFASVFSAMAGNSKTIAVSTDAGGAKFTIHFSDLLDIPYAIANKFRPGREKTDFLGIIGELSEKSRAIILDDEMVTGSSLVNTIKTIHQAYGIEEIFAAISHNKIRKETVPLLIKAHKEYGLKKIHTTDSIPQSEEVLSLEFIEVHSLGGVFASTINRLHYNRSVSEFFLQS